MGDIQILYLLNGLAGRSHLFDALIVFCAEYLPYLLIVVFFALVYFSRYAMREKFKIFSATVCSVVIARLGVTELIRFFYHRPRPFVVLPIRHLLTEAEWSFPSGHAAFFFAMATAIYLYNKKWGAGFLVASVLITVARVVAGVHYPSDIIGGALIGIAVAYAVVYIAEKKAPVVAP